MSRAKFSLLLILAIGLGFGGGILGQVLLGGGNNNLTNRIDSVEQTLNEVQSTLDNKVSTATLNSKLEGLDSAQHLSDLQQQVTTLQNKVKSMTVQTTGQTPAKFKVGFINAKEAFTVFTNAVQQERNKVKQKTQEMVQLYQKYEQENISTSKYRQQMDKLRVEKLQAQLAINLSMIDQMIASTGFQTISDQLKKLKKQAQPVDQALTTLSQKISKLTPQEVTSRLNQINSQYKQLDQLLTGIIEQKISEVANTIGESKSFDLVLKRENTVLYNSKKRVVNLTEEVKAKLKAELQPAS